MVSPAFKAEAIVDTNDQMNSRPIEVSGKAPQNLIKTSYCFLRFDSSGPRDCETSVSLINLCAFLHSKISNIITF